MNDRDFMRYSRQILLDDIALDGQQNCSTAVLIIGLGGLGTPAALWHRRGWRRDAGTGR
ncbi:hypothetical protein [Escherichia coli]|uniref:hypothetical protein n=1 Tax=Escherichia coli TaxID=562 RepID=UPI003EC0534F